MEGVSCIDMHLQKKDAGHTFVACIDVSCLKSTDRCLLIHKIYTIQVGNTFAHVVSRLYWYWKEHKNDLNRMDQMSSISVAMRQTATTPSAHF